MPHTQRAEVRFWKPTCLLPSTKEQTQGEEKGGKNPTNQSNKTKILCIEQPAIAAHYQVPEGSL